CACDCVRARSAARVGRGGAGSAAPVPAVRRGCARCIARPCQNDDVRTMARPVASLLAALVLLGAGSACAEAPKAGGRERHWYLVRAGKEFEAGRFAQALVSFEAAARLAEEPLPDETLRRWGLSASAAGWPPPAHLPLPP